MGHSRFSAIHADVLGARPETIASCARCPGYLVRRIARAAVHGGPTLNGYCAAAVSPFGHVARMVHKGEPFKGIPVTPEWCPDLVARMPPTERTDTDGRE